MRSVPLLLSSVYPRVSFILSPCVYAPLLRDNTHQVWPPFFIVRREIRQRRAARRNYRHADSPSCDVLYIYISRYRRDRNRRRIHLVVLISSDESWSPSPAPIATSSLRCTERISPINGTGGTILYSNAMVYKSHPRVSRRIQMRLALIVAQVSLQHSSIFFRAKTSSLLYRKIRLSYDSFSRGIIKGLLSLIDILLH